MELNIKFALILNKIRELQASWILYTSVHLGVPRSVISLFSAGGVVSCTTLELVTLLSFLLELRKIDLSDSES